MKLYNLTLEPTGAVIEAIYGNFSGNPKAQEILIAKNGTLSLIKPDESGDLVTICDYSFFGLIRTVKPIRLTGDVKDYIVVGNDSGAMLIIEYSEEENTFKQVQCELFGKTGVRRVVPGQYVAVDPKGRAVLTASIERNKLVYVVNRDTAGNITISSPLEAHQQNVLLYDIVALDVGYDNPIFAAIEVNYESSDGKEGAKSLTFYELDLGLNHVVRKWTKVVHESANRLIPLPGDEMGPGGVLLCQAGGFSFYSLTQDNIYCQLPQRLNPSGEMEDPAVIVCTSVLAQKSLLFILVQTNQGDLFKLGVTYQGDEVSEVNAQLFDTIKVCKSLCITRKGLLFAAADSGDHMLYQIVDNVEGLGGQSRDLSPIICTSSSISEAAFVPRALTRLRPLDKLISLAPCMGLYLKPASQGKLAPVFHAICGSKTTSTLRRLHHGLSCINLATTDLPGRPISVFTLKAAKDDDIHKFIVVSYINLTLILSVGDKVEQVKDSGLILNKRTVFASLLNNDSILQVHENGFRHLRPSTNDKFEDWSAGDRTIREAAATLTQLALFMNTGDIIYFELNELGNLSEITTFKNPSTFSNNHLTAETNQISLGFSEVEERAKLLAASYPDQILRVLAVEGNEISEVAVQALPEKCSSLCFNILSKYELTLFVGLSNGVLITTNVDPNSGQMKESNSKFLGTRSVTLCSVQIKANDKFQPAVVALSGRNWILHNKFHGNLNIAPINYPSMLFVDSFSNDQADGLVSICESDGVCSLRIFYIDNFGNNFSISAFQLMYTPRAVLDVPNNQNHILLIEADTNVPNTSQIQQSTEKFNKIRQEMFGDAEPLHQFASKSDKLAIEDDPDDEPELQLSFEQIGYPQAINWNSIVRVINRNTGETISKSPFEENEGVLSFAIVRFRNRNNEPFLVTGIATGLNFYNKAKKADSFCIKVHRFMPDGTLSFMISQVVPDLPKALCATPDGRLLVGLGTKICLYELSQNYLLLKGEAKQALGSFALKFHLHEQHRQTSGLLSYRLFVSDASSSIRVFNYYPQKRGSEAISLLCDDVSARSMCEFEILDYETIVGSDKFGNVFVLRLPEDLEEAMEPTMHTRLWDETNFEGAPNKLKQIAQYHVGEIVTSLKKTSISPGRPELVLYSTVGGRIGALSPFGSGADSELLEHVETQMRQLCINFSGRDHLGYRSSFIPVKGVVDGDFLNQFFSLSAAQRAAIAESCNKSPKEIASKIQDLYLRLV